MRRCAECGMDAPDLAESGDIADRRGEARSMQARERLFEGARPSRRPTGFHDRGRSPGRPGTVIRGEAIERAEVRRREVYKQAEMKDGQSLLRQ